MPVNISDQTRASLSPTKRDVTEHEIANSMPIMFKINNELFLRPNTSISTLALKLRLIAIFRYTPNLI